MKKVFGKFSALFFPEHHPRPCAVEIAGGQRGDLLPQGKDAIAGAMPHLTRGIGPGERERFQQVGKPTLAPALRTGPTAIAGEACQR